MIYSKKQKSLTTDMEETEIYDGINWSWVWTNRQREGIMGDKGKNQRKK